MLDDVDVIPSHPFHSSLYICLQDSGFYLQGIWSLDSSGIRFSFLLSIYISIYIYTYLYIFLDSVPILSCLLALASQLQDQTLLFAAEFN